MSINQNLALNATSNATLTMVSVTNEELFSPNSGQGTFEVLDLTGRARQSRKQELAKGLNEVEFRLGSLPTGIYLIRALDVRNRQQ